MFSKKNDTNPMEDETSAEFLMSKNDCALFCFGSHNKKRPNNLVLVRDKTRRKRGSVRIACYKLGLGVLGCLSSYYPLCPFF